MVNGINNKQDRADELIEQFNLKERATYYPSELSTGERRRTALARALFNKPSIILADEPTGNLDEKNSIIVLQHLKDFSQTHGSVLLVTHDNWAASFANRIFRMANGKLNN